MGEVTGKTWTDYSEPRIMAADLEAIEAAITAASVIVGVGRPDIPATLTTPGTAALVAAATSGTVFRSLDGPQGAWEWRKRGTTWVCEVGDTGWVNVTASLEGEYSASWALLCRRGGDVLLDLQQLTPAAPRPAFATLITLPLGFRPTNTARGTAYEIGQYYVEAAGAVKALNAMSAGGGYRGLLRIPASQPWPTTLTI